MLYKPSRRELDRANDISAAIFNQMEAGGAVSPSDIDFGGIDAIQLMLDLSKRVVALEAEVKRLKSN